jgi:LDH2 family malate/lactate/ureidoglycolate dehydrogenase
MIEVLSAILTQAASLKEINLWFDKPAEPVNLGHFFMAFDIGAFLSADSFKDRVDQMIDELKSSPPMEGSSGIFMPGEMEYISEQKFLKSGIPVSRGVLKTLGDFADSVGISKLPC